MSVWTDNETQQVQIVQVDPLSAILNAIGDVKEIVIDVRDRDLAYLRTRVDAQWVSIGDLQKTKADRTPMSGMAFSSSRRPTCRRPVTVMTPLTTSRAPQTGGLKKPSGMCITSEVLLAVPARQWRSPRPCR